MNMLMLGHKCALYRKKILKCTQIDVAKDTGFTVSNVSAFETGRNDSSIILLWYLSHGLTLEQLIGGEPIV